MLFLLALLSGPVMADTIEMKVYGLVCGFCAQGIEKTLRRNPATADVVVSLEHQTVAVATHSGRDIPDAELTQALTDAGYDVKAINRTQRSLDEVRASLKEKRR
jgi:copper chaperone CopZ